jgi:hypothetical protein
MGIKELEEAMRMSTCAYGAGERMNVCGEERVTDGVVKGSRACWAGVGWGYNCTEAIRLEHGVQQMVGPA